jgi:DNA replication licensing factor MCM3
MPITIRTLETIIRLSTAVAKLRLSNNVTEKDVEVASSLLHRSLFSSDGESQMEIEETLS